MIIPFFIPHAGCAHTCVFCNQKNITGLAGPVAPPEISPTMDRYLAAYSGTAPVHVAFYGGSFTALSRDLQTAYLQPVQPYIRSGAVRAIRISTRPDCITADILAMLRDHHVETIELGAQSMDDGVLLLAGRGHTAHDTVKAVNLIKAHGIAAGIQLMVGLPGDSRESFHRTVKAVTRLAPDVARLYPTVVLRGTPLAELYARGRYTPLDLDSAVALCREALGILEHAGIPVIRIGLQPSEELLKPGMIIAGPFHPAFRQLVESAIFLEKMRTILRMKRGNAARVIFQVAAGELSAAIGQHRSNIDALKSEFMLTDISITGGPPSGGKRELTCLSAS